MATDPALKDEAALWAVRTGDPAFADWDAFTAWLEQDPAHASAYDAVMAAVDEVAEAGLPPAVANDDDNAGAEPIARQRPRWLGGAVAAVLALVAVVGLFGLRGGATDYVTAPGEMRTIALDDGSRIILGGDSRLSLKGDERLAELEQGVALFDLRHDTGHPFEVHAGENVLRDIGTVFEVRRDAEVTSLAVSEGAVLFNPDRQARRVDPGKALRHRDGSDKVELTDLPVALVGEWREGRHTFRDASLGEVAADLARASGVRFTAAPGAAQRRVSGSVLIAPIRSDPASLGPLLGVTVRQGEGGWILEP